MCKKESFHGFVVVPLLFLVLGLFSTVSTAAFDGEHLYLADSLRIKDPISILYKVLIDPATGRANLVPLPDVGWGDGAVPFNWVHAIAVTSDNKKLYVIDQYTGWKNTGSGKMGVYDLETPSWTEIGLVTYNGDKLRGVVQAAFAPNGTLYIASGQTEKIYSVNLTTCVATLVGSVVNQATNADVNIVGADMVFALDGSWFLYTSGSATDAPQGLYKLLPPAVGGKIPAKYIGMPDPESYTGLSIRANGIGDFISSVATTDECVEYGYDAALKNNYPFYLAGSPYVYKWGDMASPPGGFCSYTIGYWKNHKWNGATVTICGVVVDETLGKKILTRARNTNFSMLIAQMIAAKLNTNNSTGIPVIDDAEAWLCQQGVVDGGKIKYWLEWVSKAQKREGTKYKTALDNFNNAYHCDENNEE